MKCNGMGHKTSSIKDNEQLTVFGCASGNEQLTVFGCASGNEQWTVFGCASGPFVSAEEVVVLLVQVGLFDKAISTALRFELPLDPIFEALTAR